MGNPDLQPESCRSYEAGYQLNRKEISLQLAAFFRQGENLIDWIRDDPGDAWTATNHARIDTFGVEFSMDIPLENYSERLPFKRLKMQYTFIDSRKDAGSFESKYVLNYLEHQAGLTLEHKWFPGITQTWLARYEDRRQQEGHFLLDTKITWRKDRYELFAEVTNLLDTEYEEITSVPMPGTWWVGGLKFKF